MHILLTGFEPFGGEKINPSWLIAQALDKLEIQGAMVHGAQLPCVFAESLQVLEQQLKTHKPDIVVALGQATGRSGLSVERIAINVCDARIADNKGDQPIDEPVIDTGPAAYFSTLPIKSIVQALLSEGCPASVSQTAGTYVCNQVFYGLQHLLKGVGALSGFIHVPLLPEQAEAINGPLQPSMALSEQINGIKTVLRVLVEHRRSGGTDVRLTGGLEN